MMNYDFLTDNNSEKIIYHNNDFPINTWRAYSNDFAGLSEVNHWHNDFEFVYVNKGEMFYNVNGKEIHLPEGTLIFINSGNMHFGFQKIKSPCEFTCLICPPTFILLNGLDKYLSGICGNNSPSYLLYNSNSFQDKSLTDEFIALHHSVMTKNDGYEFQASGSLYKIFFKIYDNIKNSTHENQDKNRIIEIMHTMTGFIQSEYASKITISDIAAAGFVCRSKCCSIFKSFLGKTPMEYLTEYRLSKGIDLLTGTNMSVTEISGECGFCSPSYFTEVFVRKTGYTPKEFRKMMI